MAEISPKREGNAVEKGEIAHYEQFLIFLQCYQKTCTANTYKQGLVLESVKTDRKNLDVAVSKYHYYDVS